jgi:hypothetical protein
VITTLYTAPPPGSVVVCIDELGPESAKSFPGQELVPVQEPAPLARLEPPTAHAEVSAGTTPMTSGPPNAPACPVGRAVQEVDDGRRGKG